MTMIIDGCGGISRNYYKPPKKVKSDVPYEEILNFLEKKLNICDFCKDVEKKKVKIEIPEKVDMDVLILVVKKLKQHLIEKKFFNLHVVLDSNVRKNSENIKCLNIMISEHFVIENKIKYKFYLLDKLSEKRIRTQNLIDTEIKENSLFPYLISNKKIIISL